MFGDKRKNSTHPFRVKTTRQPPVPNSVALENYLEELYSNLLQFESLKLIKFQRTKEMLSAH